MFQTQTLQNIKMKRISSALLTQLIRMLCEVGSPNAKTSTHHLPVLLLLSKHQSLAVAVLLQHLMKNSVPTNRGGNFKPKKWKSERIAQCLDFSHFVLQLLHLSKIGEMGGVPQPQIAIVMSLICLQLTAWLCFNAFGPFAPVPTSNEDCCFKLSISC